MVFERAVSSALPSIHDIKLIKSETSGFPWRGLCVKIANILYCLSSIGGTELTPFLGGNLIKVGGIN